jgi:NAD(P)H-binding
MIVITGATGQLGLAVVENILRHGSASQITLSVRKPEDAGSLKARGMDVRRGDFDEPESLTRSFTGADRLLLISASGIDHEKRSARHRNAIHAAGGVDRDGWPACGPAPARAPCPPPGTAAGSLQAGAGRGWRPRNEKGQRQISHSSAALCDGRYHLPPTLRLIVGRLDGRIRRAEVARLHLFQDPGPRPLVATPCSSVNAFMVSILCGRTTAHCADNETVTILKRTSLTRSPFSTS